jgi:4-diphosphocytidyl-2-C-methyl-D-erythritol kinase
MDLLSPAKINLTLHIERKREDGFHDLATWMIPIGFYDHLEIEPAQESLFGTNVSELKFDSNNLIYRAIEAFHARMGIRQHYRISLKKNIPMGAGLGGGSSNAALTLRALNQLHGSPLSLDELENLAAQFGSDTAFFVRSEAAWCTGRGEKMEPKQFPTGFSIALFKPGFGVPTGDAYKAYSRLPDNRKMGDTSKTPWGELRNDLEPAVFQKYLLLPVIKDWLQAQPETLYAAMSGSGSTMFAVIANPEHGKALQTKFLEHFGNQFWTVVCGLGRGSEAGSL